jgi:hypothetical protein
MTRTVGTTRMVVAAMALLGGALGVFGDVKMAAVNQVFPRMPRTEQEQTARLRLDNNTPAAARGLSLFARERSGGSDPCVPIAPVTFSARRPEYC